MSAFWEERCLPSAVRGPVECFAFSLLAYFCAAVDIVMLLEIDLGGRRFPRLAARAGTLTCGRSVAARAHLRPKLGG